MWGLTVDGEIGKYWGGMARSCKWEMGGENR